MADETDPLVQAMVNAGLYPQRMRPIQQQYALGQQWMEPQQAQGRNVGQTYVAASPWEHLSNAIRQVVGAKMAGGALGQERELTGSLGAGRQAYVQALQRAGGQQAPGTPEMLARGPDPQEMQRLTMMGAASGDPAMENASKTAMQGQHYQNELARLTNTQQYQQGMIDLRDREQKTQFDPLGNRVTTPTHAPKPGSALPLSTGGGGPRQPKTPWSPDALDKDAEMLAVSGDYKRMPGKIGAAYDLAVRKRSTELYPDASRAADKGQYAANVNSLRKAQQSADSIDAFENTALKNLDNFLQVAHGVVDVGSPMFNAPLRSIAKNIGGGPRAAQFEAARQVAVQEIGKVLGGAVQGGAITDSQRHEVEGLLSGNASLAQLEAVAQTLRQDMTNRKTSVAQQIEAIQGRMSGKKAPPTAAPAAAPDTAALRKKYGL